MWMRIGSCLALGLILLAETARSEQPALKALSAPLSVEGAFGGVLQNSYVPASAFTPATSGFSYTGGYGLDRHPLVDENQNWTAPLGLPSGAAIEAIRVLVQDDDVAEDITVRFVLEVQSVDGSPGCDGGYYYTAWTGTSAGISGRGIVTVAGATPLTLQNQGGVACGTESYNLHAIEVDLTSLTHVLYGAVVSWRRSVSPAPLVATFNDVPTDHPIFQFVEALAASGITAGCGGGDFCPGNTLTRGQMAVFFAKALGLHFPR